MPDDDDRDKYAKELADITAGFDQPGALVPPPGASYASQTNAQSDARQAAMTPDERAALNADQTPARVLGPNGVMVNAPTPQQQVSPTAGFGGSAPQPPPSGAPLGVVRATPAQPPQAATAPGAGGPPPILGKIGATYDAQESAMRDATAAQVNANDAQTVGDAQVGQLQREQAQAAADRAKEQAEVTQRQMEEIQRMSDQAAAMKVDPGRWWGSQSTGEKVTYSLAAMLGGFAAGWTHGPNQALQQINKYMDDDIAAQRTAIEQAHGKVSDARGILSEMYTRYGNLDKAEAATKMLQINAAVNDTKAQVAAANSPAIAANGQAAIVGLEREKLLAQQRFIAAGQAQKPFDLKALHELSKDEEGNRSAAGETALSNLESLDKSGQGDVPGSSFGGRLLGSLAEPDDHGRRGFIAGIANNLRGGDARQASGAMYQLAEASLPPSVRGNPEAIKNQQAALFGNGSPEDIKAGMDRARSLIGGQKANAYAGQDPRVVQAYEALQQSYNARNAPKAGLPGGSTP